MRKTRFAGLTQLDPADPLSLDNASFQAKNPDLTDRYLELGALTHRHDAHAALASPTTEASGTVIEGAGAIPADYSIGLGYTLTDSYGGESTVADGLVLSTPLPYDPPLDTIAGSADYSGGQLLIGTYYYAITLVDGLGEETSLGPHIAVERAPGYASARIQLSGLTGDFGVNGAVGWRLYRALGGQEFEFLATGNGDTFTDDGTTPVNCDVHPPSDANNTTRGANALLVVVPAGSSAVSPGAASFTLYGTLVGDYSDAFVVGNFPVSSAGQIIEIDDLDFPGQAPPDVSTCIAGAHKIDPDVELLDWHWKRPVATRTALPSGELGDVRLETGTGVIWGMLKAPSGAAYTDWTVLGSAGAGGGGGGLPIVASGRATATTSAGSALVGWDEYVLGERRTWAVPGMPSEKPVALLASGGWRQVWYDDFADGDVNDGSYTTDGNGNLASDYAFSGGEVFRNHTGQGRFVRSLQRGSMKARVKLHPNSSIAGRITANFTGLAINRLFAFDYLAAQYDDAPGGASARISLNDNSGAGIVASGKVRYPATDVPVWLEIERIGTQVVVRHYATDPGAGGQPNLTIPYSLSVARAAHFDPAASGFLRMQPDLGGNLLDLGYDDLTFWAWDGPDLRAEVASADGSVITREVLTSAATSDLYPTFISERGASGVAGSAQVTEFLGSGGAQIGVSRAGDGHQVVKITVVGGASGPAGAQGPPGADGSPGATGPTGPAGPTGSAIVAVGGSGMSPLLPARSYLEFAASGSASVAVQDLGAGSARILISASGAAGPQGPQGPAGANGAPGATGATGPAGPTGSAIVAVGGSAMTPLLTARSYVEFAASGAASVAVQDLGGGSARVLIAASGTPGTTGPMGPSGAIASSAIRRTLTVSLGSALASGASGNVSGDLGPSYRLQRIRTSKAARVRLYAGSAYRDADAGRALGTDPTGDHGLILEHVTIAADLDWALSPQVDGANLDDPFGATIPMNFTSLAASGTTLDVTFDYLLTEGSGGVATRGRGMVNPTGSAGKPRLTDKYELAFAGSGGIAVAVQDQGGGSAQVLISTSDQVFDLASATSLTIGGLDGDADRGYEISLEGRFDTNGSAPRYIRVWPNGDSSGANYGWGTRRMWWEDGIGWTTDVGTGITEVFNGLPLTALTWVSAVNAVVADFIMKAKANGSHRTSQGQYTVAADDALKHHMFAQPTAHWFNTTDKITSLVIDFGGATCLDGRLRLRPI